MRSSVAVERITSDLYAELADFHSQFEDETRAREFWSERLRLWWDDNPAWSADIHRGFVLVAGGRIVGFFGLFPTRFQIKGVDTRVWNSTTWRVDSAYRGHSLKLLAALASETKHDLLFATTAKDEIAPVMETFGFRQVPPTGGTRSMLLLNPGRLAQVLASSRPIGALIRPAAPLLRRVCVSLFRLRTRTRLRVRPLSAADGEFDVLWQRTRSQSRNTAVRSAAWVQWQCFASRWFTKDVMAAYDGPDLRGFAICVTGSWRGLAILDCVDLWFDFARPDVAPALVRGLAELGAARGYDVVQVPHFSADVAAALKGTALLRVRREPMRGYWRGPSEVIDELLAEGLYLSLLEGDRFL
jgi:hypothetical protein